MIPSRLHDLIHVSAEKNPDAGALTVKQQHLSYAELSAETLSVASGLIELGVRRYDRVAVFLEKRFETIVSFFAISNAGAVLVPVNPVLKAPQVGHILRDSGAVVLITSQARLSALKDELSQCPELTQVVLVDDVESSSDEGSVQRWTDLLKTPPGSVPHVIDEDLAAVLYTSGSTGRPKGVMLSHRNMVVGARSVAQYLENSASDCILSALPLSFDAGFSQVTTAFSAGARVVLLNYLLPRDVLRSMEREGVTGLTAVPPLWIQLAQLKWPDTVVESLRYFANTGGHMPAQTLAQLREALPHSKPYLMYGLTEAFRATYLPPDKVDAKPDSMGKTIPNSEVFVLREDGSCCDPNEPGELVQRGALVGMGYWNDPEKTAVRYKPLPDHLRPPGVVQPELAVYSGDVVRQDEDGYLYFVGRRDEMIKSSGYRISPNEVEETLLGMETVKECAVFGVPHESLGQAICAVVHGESLEGPALLADCRRLLPAYMVPTHLEIREQALPRNANGKIDRSTLSSTWLENNAERT